MEVSGSIVRLHSIVFLQRNPVHPDRRVQSLSRAKPALKCSLDGTLSSTAGQGQWKEKAAFPNLGVMNLDIGIATLVPSDGILEYLG